MNKKIPFKIKVQTNTQSCFFACVKWYAYHLTGEKFSERELYRIGMAAQKQTSFYQNLSPAQKKQFDKDIFVGEEAMKATLEKANLEGFISRAGTLETLEWFISRDIPVIVDVQNFRRKIRENPRPSEYHPHGHYTIVRGIEGDRLWISDPGRTYKQGYSLPYSELEKRWFDPIPEENHWMMILTKPEDKIKIPFKGKYI